MAVRHFEYCTVWGSIGKNGTSIIICAEVAIGSAVYPCPVLDLGVRASTEWVRLGFG